FAGSQSKMPPQQRQRLVDVVGGCLNFSAHRGRFLNRSIKSASAAAGGRRLCRLARDVASREVGAGLAGNAVQAEIAVLVRVGAKLEGRVDRALAGFGGQPRIWVDPEHPQPWRDAEFGRRRVLER